MHRLPMEEDQAATLRRTRLKEPALLAVNRLLLNNNKLVHE
jgi:hypothetical protein